MQPNQQPNPGQQPETIPKPSQPGSPYEFIMAPPVQPKRAPGLPGLGGKLPIIIGGVVGVVILFIVIIIALSSGGGSGATLQLASLSAEQQEIIRISDLTLKLSKDSRTLAIASTVKSSLSSEQKATLELLSSQGGQLAKGQLNSKLSKKSEESLNSASQSNTLDTAYNSYLKTNLATYQKNLKLLYTAGGPKTKSFADQAYTSTGLVLDRL